MDELEKRVYSGVDILLEKAEKIAKTESEMTLEELGEMTDIFKDISEVHKNMAKAHACYSEHSIKRY